MQRMRRARAFPEAQMIVMQLADTFRGERRRPRDGRAGGYRTRYARGRACLPSRTANGVRGGAGSMAQRFFSGSGTTLLTSRRPAGSGGK